MLEPTQEHRASHLHPIRPFDLEEVASHGKGDLQQGGPAQGTQKHRHPPALEALEPIQLDLRAGRLRHQGQGTVSFQIGRIPSMLV